MTTKPPGQNFIGKPMDRVDGMLKVTGQARYSADTPDPKMAYGVLVQSTIAGGTITKIDVSSAEKLPGVLGVLTHLNAPRVKKPKTGNPLLLLQDNVVQHAGQNIAVVVAESLETATLASQLIEVSYKAASAKTDLDRHNTADLLSVEAHKDYNRGNIADGLAQGKIHIEQTYITPTEFHNPMEPFATVAMWDNEDKLTLYETTQGVFPSRKTVAETLGMPVEKVQVIAHFLGGGFGCKLVAWSHALLTAMAAKQVKRPVKLVVQRRQMFGPVGFRPRTIQNMLLAATKEGKLTGVCHSSVSESSLFSQFVEAPSEPVQMLYACPNVNTSNRIVQLNIGAPIWMRAPGDAPGSFALESAMDELAEKIGLDPIELRLRNYAEVNPESGLPWSSKSLRQCYKTGAERFGWPERKSQPRSIQQGKYLVGRGMASATHGTYRGSAQAIAELFVDGKVTIKAGTQDIGTGTYTILTQIAADVLGVPPESVKVELGDTNLPPTPLSGGSMTAATVGSAVYDVCALLLTKLKELAASDKASVFADLPIEKIEASAGRLYKKDDSSVGELYIDVLKGNKKAVLQARAESKPNPAADAYAKQSFGAQFARVHVDSELGTVQVTRLVGVYGAGRILNAKTARSQMIGGLIFGMGMALFEEGLMDHELGRVVNSDLEHYHLPVHADMPEFDITFLEEEDPHINSIGAKGIGELGITGAAAAIVNAVYNATGVRVRDLPVSLDKLL